MRHRYSLGVPMRIVRNRVMVAGFKGVVNQWIERFAVSLLFKDNCKQKAPKKPKNHNRITRQIGIGRP